MTNPPPRLVDVARHAGVSLATASRVLGSSPYPVSEVLDKQVRASAEALDYIPNAHARALASAVSATVGLIVHDVKDPYFSEISSGVLRASTARERLVMICPTFRESDSELKYVQSLRAQHVEAIVMAGSGVTLDKGPSLSRPELRRFVEQGGRVAMIGRHEMDFDAVLPDNRGGAQRATEHLIGIGHRHIGIVAGPAGLTTVEDRVGGISDALSLAGIPRDDAPLIHTGFDRMGGRQAAGRLFDSHPGLTAIIALNDPMAIGVIAVLRERGLRVPQDISVVGFNDIPAATDIHPQLTTVQLPMEQMGAAAAELVLDPQQQERRTVPIGTKLVIRESTAPPSRQSATVPSP